MANDTSVSCYPFGDLSESDIWYIALHNPATVSHKFHFIDVPNNYSYTVYAMGEDGEWTEVPSDLFTYTATMDDKESTDYTTSQLIVKTDVAAFDLTYLKMVVTGQDQQQ